MYKLPALLSYQTEHTNVIRLSDGASIPFADGNMDYEEYKLWLAEGNTPLPADEQGASA